MLTFKLCMLIALLTEHHTLHAICLKDTTLNNKHVKFRIKKLLKRSKPGRHLRKLCIKAYAPGKSIFVELLVLETLISYSLAT